MSDESYWTYKAGSPTPGHAKAVACGAFRGTEQQWESLTPGMRREIVRSFVKRYPPCPVPLPSTSP